jgi:hypothetical protein
MFKSFFGKKYFSVSKKNKKICQKIIVIYLIKFEKSCQLLSYFNIYIILQL